MRLKAILDHIMIQSRRTMYIYSSIINRARIKLNIENDVIVVTPCNTLSSWSCTPVELVWWDWLDKMQNNNDGINRGLHKEGHRGRFPKKSGTITIEIDDPVC